MILLKKAKKKKKKRAKQGDNNIRLHVSVVVYILRIIKFFVQQDELQPFQKKRDCKTCVLFY
jgi:hypothetical protein